MVGTWNLKLGLVILFLMLVLIVAAVISLQHISTIHSLAASMVEYA